MKKTLFSAALAAAFGLVAMQASAADGTITFNGEVTDVTCTVTGAGNATGVGNITVGMPTVSRSALNAAGSVAGVTPFQLVLGGGATCVDGKMAALWIETTATPALDKTTGALINQLAGGSTAEVQVLNGDDSSIINLGVNASLAGAAAGTKKLSNNQPVATIAGNTATLNYASQYLNSGAAGSVTAGKVSTYMTYSMQYN